MSESTSAARRPDLNALLVYDGDCAFCMRSVAWAQRRLKKQPRIEAWQDLDLDRYGLTARECNQAVQYVQPGRKESGARGIGRLLKDQGGLWRLVAWVPFVWPFSSFAEWLYGWVARNRHRLPGGTAACTVQRNAPPPEVGELPEHLADDA